MGKRAAGRRFRKYFEAFSNLLRIKKTKPEELTHWYSRPLTAKCQEFYLNWIKPLPGLFSFPMATHSTPVSITTTLVSLNSTPVSLSSVSLSLR